MRAPFPFIIWSPDPGWPCWKRCEGKRFQMCISDRAVGERGALRRWSHGQPPPHVYFQILSSLWHPFRDLLQTPASRGARQAAEKQHAEPTVHFIWWLQRGVRSNRSALQTKKSCAPSWQPDSIHPSEVSLKPWNLTRCSRSLSSSTASPGTLKCTLLDV